MKNDDVRKSSILIIPHILQNCVVIQPWRQGHNKRIKTGVVAAPIEIDRIRYICCVVFARNINKEIRPYAIRLFDKKQIEDLINNNNVHHNIDNVTSHSRDIIDSNPQTVAKVLQKYLLSNIVDNKNQKNNNSQDSDNRNSTKPNTSQESDDKRDTSKSENSSYSRLSYNEKKRLYESIIYEIAKIVKSKINQLD